jgi:hypothetical protein
VDASFAERFKAQLGSELSDQELAALLAVLNDDPTDPDQLLAQLRARLEALRHPTQGQSGTSAPRPGARISEGIENQGAPAAPAGGLDTEQTVSELRKALAERPASEWPSTPGAMMMRSPPGAADGLLFARNAQGERCLQRVLFDRPGAGRLRFTAASPQVCTRDGAFVTAPSALVLGKEYRTD